MKKKILIFGLLFLLFLTPISVLAKDSLKIGAILPLTGPISISEIGLRQKRSLDLLVDDINNKGGIKGRKVEIIFGDSQAKPDIAAMEFNRLVTEEKVSAIIGPSLASTTFAVSQVSKSYGIPIISMSSHIKVNDPDRFPYVFQSPPNDALRVQKTFEEVEKSKIKEIVLFNSYEKPALFKYMEDQSKKFNISLITPQSFDRKESIERDMQDYMSFKIKKKQSVIFSDYNFNLTNESWEKILGQQDNSLYILFPKIDKLNISPIFPKSSLINVITPRFLYSRLMRNQQKEITLSFAKHYSEIYHEQLGVYELFVHDSFMILKDALSNIGADGSKIRNYIENMRNFQGAIGVYNFSKKDHNGLSSETYASEKVSKKTGCTNENNECKCDECDCKQCAKSQKDCNCKKCCEKTS